MWSCLFLLVVMLSGGSAFAQLTPAQRAEMKQHYEKATRAYDIQKFSEAVEEYQQAYEIGGDPAMLYNVAQAYRLGNQPDEALRFYRRYLQRSPNARNREDVERKIADLEKTLEQRRKIAEAAAAQAAAAAATALPPEVAPQPPPPPPPPPPPSTNGKLVAGIVVASVGVAALAAAGITGKLASNKADQLTSASMNNDRFDPNVEKSGKTLNTIAIVSAIVGGAATVTGVVLMILSRGGSTEERHALVSPVVGAGYTGASATFQF